MSADRITEPYDVLENHFDPVKHEGDIFFLSLSHFQGRNEMVDVHFLQDGVHFTWKVTLSLRLESHRRFESQRRPLIFY